MTESPPPAAGPRRRAILIPLLLAALAYGRVLHGEFQFDDRITIEQNPAIKSLARFFGQELLGGVARPLTDLTFALNYAAGRLDPFGYHLVNLLLHLAAVLLVHRLSLRVLRRAGEAGAGGLALAVAGVFAVHPLQSQAVSYVTQRAECLASLLYVASLLLLLRSDEGSGRAAWASWGGALLLFALGLKAKAIVVTLPAAWVLLALAIPRREGEGVLRRGGAALLKVAPFAALAALFAWSALGSLGGSQDAGFQIPGLTPARYAATELRVVLGYLRLLAWPAGQNLDPVVPLAPGLDAGAAGFAVANFLLAGGAAALLGVSATLRVEDRAAARAAGFGILWYYLLLAPTSTVVPLADVMQEHRAYLASWGPMLAAAVAAERLLARWPAARRRAGPALAALAWCGLAVALHLRNAVWESKIALWSDVVAKSPGRVRAHMNLGHSLTLAGALEPALAEYRRAAALPPDDSVTEAELARNVAAALIQAGRPAEAAGLLQGALARAPLEPELLNNLAISLLDLGRPAEAEGLARRALASPGGGGPALNTLGEALLAQGNPRGALEAFERAAGADPDVAVRHYNVALALQALGRDAEACQAVRRALAAERDPARRTDPLGLAAELRCGP